MADDTDVLVPEIHEDQLPGSEARLEPKPEWHPRYPRSGRLKDKVALVTGADSGIGRAVAALFAREGADIAIVYLCEHEDAEKSKQIVEEEGRRAITIAGDIGSKEFCDEAVRKTIDAFGRLYVLVNNAGEQHPDKDVRDITEEQLRRTFQTNIFGMFFMTQAARPHLKKGAAIINCTSVTMYKGSPDLLDYSSTKGAITAFTRSLAKNLVKDGIRVNAVAPGPIWTPLNPYGGQPPEDVKDFGKDSPMGRPGQPNEVAPSFLFLACDDASYMTGQVMHPDGGESTSS
jgi:NAD(P)-dependent dehydrogenase (short-subunit alcohol dehydrogenase family)